MIGRKIFVNGSFDILHVGHLDLLKYAKSLGDHLLVAIDSDRRISEKKGPLRPFNDEVNRFALMSELKPVDEVAVFDSDKSLINIIKQYQPDIMIVGSDWKGKPIIGSQFTKDILYYERTNNESTTRTLKRFTDR